MCYIINSDTINIGTDYTFEFFNDLKEKFHFPYEILYSLEHEQIVKDMFLEDKLINDDLMNALSLQDYDLRNYLYLMLSSLLSITDITEVRYGTQEDLYLYEGNTYRGDQYTFVELAYENDWNVISLKNIDIKKIVSPTTKNEENSKNIYNVCNITQLLLVKSLFSEHYLERFFSSFEKVYCIQNCEFNNWETVNEMQRLKILATFYQENKYIIHNEFNNLGHFHGRNANRVEKIGENLYEYRISNPNYRIYYTRRNEKLIIILCMLKRRGKISKNTINNLICLKNSSYVKINN